MTTSEDLYWTLTEGADAIEYSDSFTIGDLKTGGHIPVNLPAAMREAANLLRKPKQPIHPEDVPGSTTRLGPIMDHWSGLYSTLGDMPVVNARTGKPTVSYEVKHGPDGEIRMEVRTS